MSTKKYNRFEFAHKEQPKHGEMKIKKKTKHKSLRWNRDTTLRIMMFALFFCNCKAHRNLGQIQFIDFIINNEERSIEQNTTADPQFFFFLCFNAILRRTRTAIYMQYSLC